MRIIHTLILGVFLFFSAAIPLAGAQTKTGGGAITALPQPILDGTMSLEAAISRRRSVRQYAPKALTQAQLGQLLWAAQGVTSRKFGASLRAVPSAGALYPLEVYVATVAGVFHYLPEDHALEQVASGDIRTGLAEAAFGQGPAKDAAAVFIICADYERTAAKYGARAERFAHLEAGHAAQNIHLQATSLGLASLPMGGYEEVKVAQVLKTPAAYVPVYMIPVGYAK